MNVVWDSTFTRRLAIDSLPKDYHRDGSGNVDYIDVTDRDGSKFRRTFTRDGSGRVTHTSDWVQV